MAYIIWTKTWSSADDGTILTGAQLGNLEADIAAAVNGGLTDINISNSAAIQESKVAFNTTTGHYHNGTDSRLISIKHYRKGGAISRVDTQNLTVGPLTMDIGGVLVKSTAVSSSIDVAVGGNWLNSESEPADGPIFVVAYNNSGVPGFKLTTSAPTMSYTDETTDELPLRYIKVSGVYYRYVGLIHNRVDLVADSIGGFDKGNVMVGSFISDAADETIYTLWTPKYIKLFYPSDTTPATGEAYITYEVHKYDYATANPHLNGLNYQSSGGTHNMIANSTACAIKAITAQAVSTPGSFQITAPTTGIAISYIAWTDEN
jgi:hypothetical protein